MLGESVRIHRYVDEGCQAKLASWEVEVRSEDSVEREVSIMQDQNLTR